MRVWLLSLAFLALLACGDEPDYEPVPPPPFAAQVLRRHHVDWDASARTEALAEGRAAIERHECNRCHTFAAEGDADHVPPAGRADHCTSCHQWIKGMAPGNRHYDLLSSRYGEAIVQRYQRNIDHYQEAPDLTGVARRLDPRWIDTFLQQPTDLRPAMEETMPRLQLGEADRRAIVRYFAAAAEVADPYATEAAAPHAAPSTEHVARGRELFLTRGCTACHTFGNLETGKTLADLRAVGLPARLAPNLRFTRERMSHDVVVAWIEDPAALKPGTSMPDLQLSHEDAERVADFLLHGDVSLAAMPPEPSLQPPAPVDRPVGWAEVKDRVLGRICVHCHMNEHERDQGPGNEGGFGWPGARLAMRTYETLVRGAVDPATGEAYSVLVPREGQTEPPLVLAMMTRRREERRDRVDAFQDRERPDYPAISHDHPLGMPMGLPSIPDDEVVIVRAWIAQGCPGPTEVTGMPGITDGFLVPDGPITQNQGCERRDPATERPAWSTQPPPEWERPRDAPTNPSPATPNDMTTSSEMSGTAMSSEAASPTSAGPNPAPAGSAMSSPGASTTRP
ncbi:MAG: cytochrome c [Polyangiales bacterium]